MWHASVAGHALASAVIRRLALQALRGVGLEARQWEDDRPGAYHVRRRLTETEQLLTGDVCDLRGKSEGWERFERIKTAVPPMVHQLAMEELRQ